MRDKLKFLLIILISLVFQVTLFSRLPAADFGPDLLLVISFSAGFLQGSKEGLLVGFTAGFLQDVLLGGNLGLYAIARMLTGGGASLLRGKVYQENFPLVTLLLLVFTFFHEVLIFLLSEQVIFRVNFFQTISYHFIPTSIYTMLVGILLYLFLYQISAGGEKADGKTGE